MSSSRALPLDFNRITPMPDDLVDDVADGHSAWLRRYEWALVNWGTRSNPVFGGIGSALAVDPEVELPAERHPIVEPGKAFFAFETAWSPPIPVLSTLAARFPDLQIQLIWGEVGCGAGGRVIWRGGRLALDEEMPVDEALNSKELWF